MRRRKRLQYQSRAEVQPIITAEPVTADRWQPSLPARIIRKIGLPAAILAGSLFFTQLAPLVHGWEPRTIESPKPKPSLSRAIQSGSCFWPERWVEPVTADRWQPTYTDRLLKKPPLRQADISFVYVPPVEEVITADKWQPTYPERLPRRSLIRQSDISFVWVPPTAEVITADRWQPQYPHRITRRPRPTPTDIAYVPLPRVIPADSWLPTYPDRFAKPLLSRAIQAGSFFYTRYVVYIPPEFKIDIFVDVTTMEVKKFMIDVIARSINVNPGDLLVETDGSAIYVLVKKPIIIRVA